MGASVLQDLVVVIVVAAAATLLFHRLKQPMVLGYLIAGAVIGPYTTPFTLVGDVESIRALAELGLVFLLFALGLEFNLRKLRRVGSAAIIAAFVEIALMLWIGYEAGRAFGWSPMDSIFLGAILSISSTTIIVKVLMEMGKVGDDFAEITFGILIVEDLIAVGLVAVLGGVGATGTLDVEALVTSLTQLGLYVLITIAVGLVVVPRLIEWVARRKVEEFLVLIVVGLVLLNALLAIKLGLSVAVGAFLMGALIAESRAVRSVEHKITPIRDLFTAVFFVAAGMLLDPAILVQYWFPILVITAIAVVGKVVAGTLGVLAGGYPGRTAVRSGLSLGQIGEFSFIIAALGLAIGAISPFLYPVAIAVSLITTMTTPLLIRRGDGIATALARFVPGRVADVSNRYAAHVAHVRSEREQRDHAERPDGLSRPVIYAAWLLGLLIAAGYASLWLGRTATGDVEAGALRTLDGFLGIHIGVAENVVRSGAFTLFALLALPLFASFGISMDKWLRARAGKRHLEPGNLGRAIPSYRRPRVTARIFAVAASAGLLALALRIAWGVHPLLIPDPVFLLPLVVVVIAASALAWPHLVRAHRELDRTLDVLLGRAEDLAPFGRLEGRYPWGMVTETVRINPGAEAAFASLASIRLADTGVTLLGVERAGHALAAPHPDLILLPNDKLSFIGRSEQVAKAARLLTRAPEEPASEGGKKPETATLEFAVPPGSPAVGCNLEQLALDRAGVRVLHHARQGRAGETPDPRRPMRVGDRLVLRGQPRDVERVRATLRLTAPPPGRPPIAA